MNKWTNVVKYVSATFFFIITVISIIFTMFLLNEFRNSPELTKENLVDALSSRIYDKNNNLIATIGNERREYVSVEEIPEEVKDAVLSVEDSRFYSHVGVDPKRIAKAFIVNVSAGSSLEGGSTITQQVVKTSLLTSSKTYERKIQEAFLSLKLESKYTKDDILEMYLNKIFYSDHQYGIKSAAKYFYNKELSELTIPQIALLAGLPQQPVGYNPYDNPSNALERRNTVLYAMYNNDKITRAQYEEYIKTPIEDGLVQKNKEDRQLQNISNPKYGAYVDMVVNEIKNSQLFAEEKDPFALGLHIYTNLDPELQEYTQNMLDNQSTPMIKHASQAAITVLNTKNGLVEAVGGGKNYTYGDFNYATDAKVQAGSSIKPILDYAPGIEYYGWDSLTTFSDTPYLIAGTNHYIQNWDRAYHGNVTMRRALAMSYNVPAVRAFESIGYERSKLFASKLGIELTSEAPTSAIGGNVDTVSPIKMAGAFAAFGNGGMYNKPSGIIKILDKQGNEINNFKEQPTRAMNASTAFIMTDILKDVVTSNGTSPNGRVAGFDLAAKSGSSTFDESAARMYGIDVVNSTKDSWMIGYTTEHTVAVWQGADSVDSASKALNANQAQTTQLIMADIIKKAHNNIAPANFQAPSTVSRSGNTYYATDRNTETDNMYVGTSRDSVYQSKISERNRETRNNIAITTNNNNNTNSNNNTNNSNTTTNSNTNTNNSTNNRNRNNTQNNSNSNNR